MEPEDVEDYDREVELALFKEYRDVVGMFKHVVETERRLLRRSGDSLGEDLPRRGGRHREGVGPAEGRWFPLEEVLEACRKGELPDAKTEIAITRWLAMQGR